MSLLRRRFSSPSRNLPEPPDPRVWGRDYKGLRPWIWGLLIVVLLAALSVLAYTKEIPFTDPGYEVHATFENAATLGNGNPVRIAGVEVGEVTDIESSGDAARVSFSVDDAGRPIREDAEATIRPRLFLEGNFFIDLRPGSPSAPELEDDAEIPITRTQTAVQLDQVLTALQSDSRRDLQQLLEGYGTGLTYQPTAADDKGQDPDVRGESAAESLNDAFEYGGRAGRSTAIVNDALRGRRPNDLSKLIRAQRDVFRELEGHESQLQGLITNFNITTGALAQESQNFSATLAELAPTLEIAEPSLRHTSEALPPLRALARELEPSIRELPGTIEASGPWLDQMKLLLRDEELGGLARLLGRASRPLARTSREALKLLPAFRDLSRCATQVLEPTGNIAINDGFANGAANFHEFFYGASNTAASGASFDGNGQYLRAHAGGGPQLLQAPYTVGLAANVDGNKKVWGYGIEAPAGVQPVHPDSPPPIRTGVACHTNPVPDVNAAPVAAPDLTPAPPPANVPRP
jgi:phospholipid/cholesterol/gamma-HCH transport system substrate-binding protein